MNNDLISRSALKRKFRNVNEGMFQLSRVYELIDNAPTVDITCPNCDSGYAQGYSDGYLKSKEERPQGKWTQISPAKIYECSECHQVVMTSDIESYLYCHHCGADMRFKGGRE